MSITDAWTPAAYGLTPGSVPRSATSSITPNVARHAGPGIGDLSAPLWHPDNPLWWLALIGVFTFGLAAVSATGRVGPVKGSLGVGKGTGK